MCRSHQYVDHFVGTMKEDGARQGGDLDNRLTKGEIAGILKMCADHFRRNLDDRLQAGLAAKFYMLAEDGVSLVTMLNQLLARTDEDTESKRYDSLLRISQLIRFNSDTLLFAIGFGGKRPKVSTTISWPSRHSSQ